MAIIWSSMSLSELEYQNLHLNSLWGIKNATSMQPLGYDFLPAAKGSGFDLHYLTFFDDDWIRNVSGAGKIKLTFYMIGSRNKKLKYFENCELWRFSRGFRVAFNLYI